MKSIQSMNIFSEDDEFKKIKDKSIDKLVNDPLIIRLMEEQSITKEDIESNWVDFLNYQEDNYKCVNCKGIDHCNKVSIGLVRILTKENMDIHSALTPCKYGEERMEEQMILTNIKLRNVNEKMLLTKICDLTILNDEESNSHSVLKKFQTYLKNPTNKGFYLYGNSSTGKSTLMGLLIRNLAKNNKCGYIHFPTFLMDLKNSFSDGGTEETISLMKNLPFLVIDDVGGENVTPWSRDEILSSILSYRLQNNKATFFTSEYSLDKLAKVYTIKKDDELKVKRLIDRMKAVSIPLNLKGRNLRG